MTQREQVFELGDHLKAPRLGGIYWHHGIYVGGSRPIIHYSGDLSHKRGASIRRATLRQFSEGEEVTVVAYGTCRSPADTVGRAESRLGENGYNLFGNNCEHFARWCKTDEHQSEQVKDASVGAGGVGGSAVATGAAIGAVAAAGTAAGLSGAGIMSGLAAVGGMVGGGAVAGVALLGAAPGAVTTIAMGQILKHDPAATSDENEARRAGRTATAVGAAAGTAASVGAIAVSGSVAGLGATGITTGLAAIGATVGGGMTAGVAMTVAAPAVAAAAVGYGVYRAWKFFTK